MRELAMPYVDAPQNISWSKNLTTIASEVVSPLARKIARHLPKPEAHDTLTQSMQLSPQQRQELAHREIRAERAGGSPDIRNIAYHVQAGGFAENVQQYILRHQIGALWTNDKGFSGSREVKEMCDMHAITYEQRQAYGQAAEAAGEIRFPHALAREAALSYMKTQLDLIDQGAALRAAQPRGRERLRRWVQAKKEEQKWNNTPYVLNYFTQDISPILVGTKDPQLDIIYTSHQQMQVTARDLSNRDIPDVYHIAQLLRSSGASENFVRKYFTTTALPKYRDAVYKQLGQEFPEELARFQTELMTLYHERHSRTKIDHPPALPADDVPYKEVEFAIQPNDLLKLLPQIAPERQAGKVSLKAHQAFTLYTTYLHCADAYARHGGQDSPYIDESATFPISSVVST